MSSHISSRVDGEIYRSLSRERRSAYRTVRARSGSRERMEDRGRRSEERGRRADSSGPRARIPRPSPSPTGTVSAHDVALVQPVISNPRLNLIFPASLFVNLCYVLIQIPNYNVFSPTILQGHGCHALTQQLTSRTDSAGRKRQISKSWCHYFSFNSTSAFGVLAVQNNSFHPVFFCFVCVCVSRQRKVRRDMLTSPVVPERGRSRSREAYAQMARSGSRGRSLSMERKGSKNSSESSLVDMEEMTKALFR